MSFDSKCFDLAEHFLPSTASEQLKSQLAQAIQDCVESFCEDTAEELAERVAGCFMEPRS